MLGRQIHCRKSEIEILLAHEQSCPPACGERGRPSGAPKCNRKSARKNFSRFSPRNLLISHASDERIQGTPRKSKEIQGKPNRINGVFAAKRPRAKKIQTDRPDQGPGPPPLPMQRARRD